MMQETKAKLSIIIPVYGTEEFLPRCIESVIAQSYKEIEIIIVNDFSPGECDEIVHKYMEIDSRIKYIKHSKNEGLFRARVTGAEKATGDYIAFLDSDDYVSKDFYRAMVLKACTENFEIVANSTVRRSEDGKFRQFTMHNICFPRELKGEAVQNTFFAQAGECYAWHTIWNKIYKKSLWDKCMVSYRKITDHIIMTEDIAFSSLLFFNATTFASIQNGEYYYCINEKASTNSENISFEKFKKNVTDIAKVFQFVNNYLIENDASTTVVDGLRAFRKRYALLWNNLKNDQFNNTKYYKEANCLIDKIAPVTQFENTKIDFYFEKNISDFNDELERIREKIVENNIKVVSFDIFDTLLLRSVWEPQDIFKLMQNKFEIICPYLKNVNFIDIRKVAERRCRENLKFRNPEYQDVTLTEIYNELKILLNITDEQAKTLQNLENNTEKEIIKTRNTGKQLLEFALNCGKKVVFTSDMYLERDTIEEMLKKCRYPKLPLFLSSDIRLVKFSGDLFDYISEKLKVKKSEILHIGDNWDVDILIAQSKGLNTGFLPKTKDVFCNSFHKNKTNGLSFIGNIVGNSLTTWNKTISSLSYRSMLSLVSNKLFDNPFRAWNQQSDFDANPYVMGYYPLGMHILAVCSWMAKLIKKENINHVSFLARDGFLPMIAFKKLRNYFNLEEVTINYVPCSRKALMPWIIKDINGLYNLPINLYSHSPFSLVKTLKCCCENYNEAEIVEKITKSGFLANKKFTSERSYYDFLNWFKINIFSEKKLEAEKEIVARYYKKNIPENSLVFDLGYSARIPSALSNCLKYNVTYAYVHENYDSTYDYVRRDKLNLKIMYNFVPQNRDLIREMFFSELSNQCLGITTQNGEAKAIFESRNSNYSEDFIINALFEGAMDFIDDYVNFLGEYIKHDEIKEIITSMPFEGLLSTCCITDKQAFAAIMSEDSVYGNKEQISITDFWINSSDESMCIRKDMINNGANIVYETGNKEFADIYKDGLFIKLYHKINDFAPKGSKKRYWIKKIANIFVK